MLRKTSRVLGVFFKGFYIWHSKPISEEVLKSWKFPVYLALAEKSKVTSQSTADNAKAIKNLTMKKWKNTTHSLPMEVPAELTQELIKFWKNAEEWVE